MAILTLNTPTNAFSIIQQINFINLFNLSPTSVTPASVVIQLPAINPLSPSYTMTLQGVNLDLASGTVTSITFSQGNIVVANILMTSPITSVDFITLYDNGFSPAIISEVLFGQSNTDLVRSYSTFSLISMPLAENLRLLGSAANNGTGNNLNNMINGNAAANVLDGGVGADKLIGGLGADTYIVDNVGDIITETSALITEIDTVRSSINYSLGANLERLVLTGSTAINGAGNALRNGIIGNGAANVLDGGLGIDTLVGGLGADTYVVENAGDIVTETSVLVTEIDTVRSSVSYSLGSNLERLVLTGTAAINGMGNALKNSGSTGSPVIDTRYSVLR